MVMGKALCVGCGSYRGLALGSFGAMVMGKALCAGAGSGEGHMGAG